MYEIKKIIYCLQIPSNIISVVVMMVAEYSHYHHHHHHHHHHYSCLPVNTQRKYKEKKPTVYLAASQHLPQNMDFRADVPLILIPVAATDDASHKICIKLIVRGALIFKETRLSAWL